MQSLDTGWLHDLFTWMQMKGGTMKEWNFFLEKKAIVVDWLEVFGM